MNFLASFWAISVFCRWNQHSWQTPHLTVAYICFSIALIILRDTLSWRAPLLVTHSRMFISGSSLAFFLPPPGSLALLLSSSERHWSSIWFFINLSLSCGRQRNVKQLLHPSFPLHILRQKVWITFYFFAAPEPWQSSMWYWLTEARTIREKGEEGKRAVSVVTSSSLI